MASKRKRSQIIQRLNVDAILSNTGKGKEMEDLYSSRSISESGNNFKELPSICFLEYGMVVSMILSDRSGIIASEGFTACDVRLEKILPGVHFDDTKQDNHIIGCHFKDCLFEIVPKMSYDASLSFEKACEHADLHKTESSTPGFSNPLSEMRFKSDSEKRLNSTAYTKLHGKGVTYGQVIQFRHVKSGKFLSAKSSIAIDASDSIDMCLASGSTASHFVLLPRFKLRRKGEPVQMTDQIVIATDTRHLFLQPSTTRSFTSTSPLLVASNSHSMQWKFISFDRSDRINSSAEQFRMDVHDGFRAGQCLRLFHLESGAWLAYDTSNGVRLDSASDVNESNHLMLSPDTLWEVERNCVYEGGAIVWSRAIYLRHVSSGKYLALGDEGKSFIADRPPQSYFIRPTTHVSSRTTIAHNSVVLLQHVISGQYVHAGMEKVVEDGTDSNKMTRMVDAIENSNDEDAFKLIPVPQAEIDDILLLSSYRRMLKRFVHSFETKSHSSGGSISSIESFFTDVLGALDAMQEFAFKDTTPDHVRRQLLLRKHQYIELVTRMLEVPFESWGGPYSIGFVSSFRQEDTPPAFDPMRSNISMTLVGLDDGDEEMLRDLTTAPLHHTLSDSSMKILYNIIRAANMLLYRMFTNCNESDGVLCGRALPILMKLLGHGFKASLPLSYLIQEKFHLSGEFNSFSRIIRDFLDLIKTQGKSIRYLQFLVVLCSGNGMAIPKIQEKICDLLFLPSEGYKDYILIQTRPTHRNEFELFLPSRKTNEGEWKSMAIFYDEYYQSNQHTTLGPYFYGLLQLYVALCMDRNYKCIEILKEKFPRKCLLAAVQDKKLARSIRAVLMNLLLVVHIDCDPQKPIALPNYTRIWKKNEIEIPSIDTTKYSLDDREFFKQVENILIGYFQKRKGILISCINELARNELTLAMMKICFKFIEFGMLHDTLNELVRYLIDLLDCRTDLIILSKNNKINNKIGIFENSVQRNKNPFTRQYSLDEKLMMETKGHLKTIKKRNSCLTSRFPPYIEKLISIEKRFQLNDGNIIVMEIKDWICNILLRIDSIRLDYQISFILSHIKERNKNNFIFSDNISPLIQALGKNKKNNLLKCEYSLEILAGKRLDTIFLQSLMYEYPPLVSKALELLYLQFNQHEQILKALNQIFLLENDQIIHLYLKLQQDVDQLRHLAETTEVWMDLTSSGDFETATRCCILLKSLINLMKKKEGIEMSQLILNLDIQQHVISMIYSGSHFFFELFPSKLNNRKNNNIQEKKNNNLLNNVFRTEQKDSIRNVYDCCMNFLIHFFDLKLISLREYALTFIDFAEELESAQIIIEKIYQNVELIPNEILNQFEKWCLFYKPQPRFLKFFCEISMTQHIQQILFLQILKCPEIINIKENKNIEYIIQVLKLLSILCTTNQRREICIESFLSILRAIELFEFSTLNDLKIDLGFGILEYFQNILFLQEDWIYKFEDGYHERFFYALKQFSIECMRYELILTKNNTNKKLMDLLHQNIINHLIPVFEFFLPKLNPIFLNNKNDFQELWSSWYVWIFFTMIKINEKEIKNCIHRSIRWFDLYYKEINGFTLEKIYLDTLNRTIRPILSNYSDDFILFDFNKNFIEIFQIIFHLIQLNEINPSKQLDPLVQSIAFVEINQDGHLPSLHVDKTEPISWFYSWGFKKNKNLNSVLPSRFSPRKSIYNMPKFGTYASDDSSMVHDYIVYVQQHKQTKQAIRDELSAMMQSILHLEDSLREEHQFNPNIPIVILTFDEVASKLVSHFQMLKQEKYVKMSIILLDVFNRMILSIGNNQSRRLMQIKLDSLGLTGVLVDLISNSDDIQVFDRCIQLGIAMLDGMNAKVQENFHSFFIQSIYFDFFRKFKQQFDYLINHNERKKIVQIYRKSTHENTEPTTKYQSALRQFRFLQLLCEGHYILNQRCMLGLHGSSINLVEIATFIVLEIHLNGSWDAMALLGQIFDTITEFCQGPCPEAQNCVAHYKFISAMNELMWHDTTDLTVTALDLWRQLKSSIVITLLSLLEGRSDREIHRRLVEELNFEALKANLIVVYRYFELIYKGKYDGNEACSDDSYLTMGFNIHILMQQLIEYEPELIDTLYPSKDEIYRNSFEFFSKRCVRVEIIWPILKNKSNDLISFYFQMHPISICLNDDTKRRLQYDVSRESNKLIDFYIKSHFVILEMQHQSTLRGHKWMAILTCHLGRIKLITFFWNIFLNGLVVFYNHFDKKMPFLILIIGSIHVFLCFLLLIGHCIHDIPLLLYDPLGPSIQIEKKNQNIPFQFNIDGKENLQDIEKLIRRISHTYKKNKNILFIILFDIKTMYYFLLFLLSICGVFFLNPLFFSFHLLDIVNRSNELRYISKAILRPGKSLIHILYFYLLSCFIFGFIGFSYFQKYFIKNNYNGCQTLWLCFLTTLDEGLKNDGGIGGYMNPSPRDTDSLGYIRMVYDLFYNIGLILILTNLAFGMIIDTFATLRSQHKEKQDDMKDRCFICSIDGYTFNRITKHGFHYHTKYQHNMWHYIYLFIHIKKKKFTEYNGIELYLAMRMAKHDVSFLPNHRALTLENIQNNNEPTIQIQLNELNHLYHELNEKYYNLFHEKNI